MRTKSIKLLTLALTAAVLGLGSAATRAALMDAIQGCLLTGVAGGTSLEKMKGACGTSNQFDTLESKVSDDVEFSLDKSNWLVTADFAEDGGTILTITNNGAARKIVAGTHILIGHLDFGEGNKLDDQAFTDVTFEGVGALGNILALPVDSGNNEDGGWYHIAFNDAMGFAKGQTVVISAKLNSVPEPGSLALLGLVVLAIGLANIKRVRLFASRTRALNHA
jgi:hypothetical protein